MRNDLLLMGVLILIIVLISWFKNSQGSKPQSTYRFGDPWAAARIQEATRQAQNARPHALTDIPATVTSVTLLMYYHSYRDEFLTMVYLLPNHVPLPPANLSSFDLYNRYADAHQMAIWAWRGDNLTDRLGMRDLTAATQARRQIMLDLLLAGGWHITAEHPYSADLTLTYLERR